MLKEKFKEITDLIYKTLELVDEQQYEQMVELICSKSDKKIFLAGVGRTGNMTMSFAMRLMHMGFQAYVVGHTETPAASEGDLLIVCSGSGETSQLVAITQKAIQQNLKIALITGRTVSTLQAMADYSLVIPSSKTVEDYYKSLGRKLDLINIGSQAERCLLICTDVMIESLKEKMGVEDAAMVARHATLE